MLSYRVVRKYYFAMPTNSYEKTAITLTRFKGSVFTTTNDVYHWPPDISLWLANFLFTLSREVPAQLVKEFAGLTNDPVISVIFLRYIVS